MAENLRQSDQEVTRSPFLPLSNAMYSATGLGVIDDPGSMLPRIGDGAFET